MMLATRENKFKVYVFVSFVGCLITGTQATCPQGFVPCNSTQVCLPDKYLCDGDADCPDAEDELKCNTRPSGCGGMFEVTGTSGYIISKNYPQNYDDQLACHWHIIGPRGSAVSLMFVGVYDIEKPRHGKCEYDGVSVHGKSASSITWPILFGKYCGSVPPAPIHTDGNEVFLEFQTDGQTTGQGFRVFWNTSFPELSTIRQPPIMTTTVAKVTSPPGPCLVEVPGTHGVITSPGFEEGNPYPTPYHCSWRIRVESRHLIALDFSYLNLGMFFEAECRGAWIKLFDGPDNTYPLIGQFCDAIIPSELLSASPIVTIEFFVESNLNNKLGFELTFSEFNNTEVTTTTGPPPPGCDGHPIMLFSSSGVVTSPDFDHDGTYRNGLNCEWMLFGDPGTAFFFSFNNFDIEQSTTCEFDSLQISDVVTIHGSDRRDNSTNSSAIDVNDLYSDLNKKLCGIILPYDVISLTNHVVLRFTSDAQIAGYGFNVSYVAKAPPVRCQQDEFLCGSDHCVPLSNVCDGQPDCSDATDEMLCPASTSCGVSTVQPSLVQERIVGGQEAREGAWPWTLSVLDPGHQHLCGATLILPGWAIGAAHCFDFVYTRRYDKYSLVSGRHHLKVPNRNEQVRQVDDVIMPRDYNSQTSYHDIALIKLAEPFNITDYASPACVSGSTAPPDTTCYITGWGETLTTCCKDVLKQAAVPIMNSALCSRPDYYGDRVKAGMMCAGFPAGGVDTCGGDSGGPLVCPSQGQPDRWELTGVTSWGTFCAYPKHPGVYSKVSDFLPWIQQMIATHS